MRDEQDITNQISGAEFVKLVEAEIAKRNTGIGRLTRTAVSREAGLSSSYLRTVMTSQKPNPTLLAMRSVLFVLGFSVQNPNEDVIPHLQAKGVYDPAKYPAAS